MTFALVRRGQWVASPPLHRPVLHDDRRQAFPYWSLDDALEMAQILKWAFGITTEPRRLR